MLRKDGDRESPIQERHLGREGPAPKIPMPSFPHRGLSLDLAAFYVGVNVDQFEKLVQDGRMPAPRIIEGRSVWDRREIDTAFDGLPGEDVAKAAAPTEAAQPAETSKRAVYTPKTLAVFWGCSESLVRTLIAQGDLKSFSLGGKLIRVRADDVAAYTARRLDAHAEEIAADSR